ncbi:hypothetical protein FXO38_06634 [Capsicum annuum]|nr:hypothetical protein FXO38_06634 [Capsicum annuum]
MDWRDIENPQDVLHNILTHNIQEEVEFNGLLESGTGKKTSEQMEEQIFHDTDLSPRAIKSVKFARKWRKQGTEESSQPVRTQPKRRGTQSVKK